MKTVLLPYDEIINLKNELEYLKQYKHAVQKSKEQMHDERELLLIEQRALEDQLAQVQENAQNNRDHAVFKFAKKTENFAERFRKQAQSNENDLKVIKSQYEQV